MGQTIECLSPLTSLVAFELASRTGPFQEISKKTLTVMFAGDVEKVRFESLMGEGDELRMRVLVRVRNRGVFENNVNGGVEILSAIWWGNWDFFI